MTNIISTHTTTTTTTTTTTNNNNNNDNHDNNSNNNNDDNDNTNALIVKKKDEIDKLQKGIKDLDKSVVEATEQRKEEPGARKHRQTEQQLK